MQPVERLLPRSDDGADRIGRVPATRPATTLRQQYRAHVGTDDQHDQGHDREHEEPRAEPIVRGGGADAGTSVAEPGVVADGVPPVAVLGVEGVVGGTVVTVGRVGRFTAAAVSWGRLLPPAIVPLAAGVGSNRCVQPNPSR